MAKSKLGNIPLEKEVKSSTNYKTEDIVYLNRNLLRLNPDNIYKFGIHKNNNKIKDLSNSISNKGIIHPLIVIKLTDEEKKKSDGAAYTIIDGNRRFFATTLLVEQPQTIPCIVKENLSEKEILELQVVSNEAAREDEDFNPIEQAIAYKKIMELNDFKTIQDYANFMGMSRSKVSRILSLLELDKRIIESAMLPNVQSKEDGETITGLNLTVKTLNAIKVIQTKNKEGGETLNAEKQVQKAIYEFNKKLTTKNASDPRIIDIEYEEEELENKWETHQYYVEPKTKKEPYVKLEVKVNTLKEPPKDIKEANKKKIKVEIGYNVSEADLRELFNKLRSALPKSLKEES